MTRVAVLTLLALIVIALGFSSVYRVAWSDVTHSDYTVYLAAGEAILDHTDIYEAHNARGWMYVYPPPFALLMIPFILLPLALGALLWYLVLLSSIVSTSIMSVALLNPLVEDRDKFLLYSLPIFSLWGVLVSGLIRGQASVLMFALIVATFYFHFRNRSFGAGLSLAAAALLKVFPIFLLLYFVWRRQWPTVASTLAGLLLIGLALPSLFLGWEQNLHNIERWAEVVGRPAMMSNAERSTSTPLFEQLMDTRKHRNQSLEALFLSADVPAHASKYLVRGLAVGMLLSMCWVASRVQSRLDEVSLAGAFVSWSLLIPPISESHYFGALLMPLTVLLGRSWYEYDSPRASKRFWITVGGAGMFAVMVLLRFDSTEWLRPLCLATLAIWGASLYWILRRHKTAEAPLQSLTTI